MLRTKTVGRNTAGDFPTRIFENTAHAHHTAYVPYTYGNLMTRNLHTGCAVLARTRHAHFPSHIPPTCRPRRSDDGVRRTRAARAARVCLGEHERYGDEHGTTLSRCGGSRTRLARHGHALSRYRDGRRSHCSWNAGWAGMLSHHNRATGGRGRANFGACPGARRRARPGLHPHASRHRATRFPPYA